MRLLVVYLLAEVEDTNHFSLSEIIRDLVLRLVSFSFIVCYVLSKSLREYLKIFKFYIKFFSILRYLINN